MIYKVIKMRILYNKICGTQQKLYFKKIIVLKGFKGQN